ncbi:MULTISPECIES: YkvA family protein [unclassified Clostridium]|uniref:YkvA family protein n=1 Tax=unclassified Clostridium TaxID=2614128 RepID=UPI003216D4AF
MKISNIKISITEKDLYSIVVDVLRDYVPVEGLKIDKILVDKNINVIGSYKHKLSIPFSVDISINKVENNKLYLSIDKINVKSLKIFKGIVNVALKVISSKVVNFGIEFTDDTIIIDLYKLCKVIPMVDFKLEDLSIIPYGLEAEVSNFNFKNENDKSNDKNEKKHEEEVPTSNVESNKKNLDSNKEYTYRRFRKEFKERFSAKYEKMYPYVVMIPDIIALFMRLYKDKRVAKEVKFNISIALGYLLFPLDILPDTVPIIGKIDDLAVTFFILQKVLCDIPEEIILDNWEGQSNIIEVSREAMTLLNDKFGAKEIRKMVDVVRISLKKTIVFFTK